MRTTGLALLLLPALGLTSPPLEAQQRTARFAAAPAPATAAAPEDGDSWARPMRLAKWGLLAASVASAAYGFSEQEDADAAYDRLEQLCVANRPRCRQRTEGGAFLDPEMEALYQQVLDRDARARTGLIASQVGIAASVALFLLDLREREGPPNVPYDPPGATIRRDTDGRLELGWRVAAGG